MNVCRSDDLFFCSSLDFERKIGIVFICVDLCGVRNNKLLNLGVRDLKKVENPAIESRCFVLVEIGENNWTNYYIKLIVFRTLPFMNIARILKKTAGNKSRHSVTSFE